MFAASFAGFLGSPSRAWPGMNVCITNCMAPVLHCNHYELHVQLLYWSYCSHVDGETLLRFVIKAIHACLMLRPHHHSAPAGVPAVAEYVAMLLVMLDRELCR